MAERMSEHWACEYAGAAIPHDRVVRMDAVGKWYTPDRGAMAYAHM
jgi:hypothetical protein